VTQTAQNLQPDYTEVSASLLTELVGLQRAIATGGNATAIDPSPLTHDSAVTPRLRDVWLNGLWFVSLSLTLSVALITGLIKQWLNLYIAETVSTPKRIACTRQFRYMGLSRWGVSPIIEMLPVLMNTSLFFFLAGLILFLQGLSGAHGIRNAVIALTGILLAFYIISSLLPIWDPQCPYKSSLSQLFNFGFGIIKVIAATLLAYVFFLITGNCA
jgi:hypothetical protein